MAAMGKTPVSRSFCLAEAGFPRQLAINQSTNQLKNERLHEGCF
jgi:hypothetical protein